MMNKLFVSLLLVGSVLAFAQPAGHLGGGIPAGNALILKAGQLPDMKNGTSRLGMRYFDAQARVVWVLFDYSENVNGQVMFWSPLHRVVNARAGAEIDLFDFHVKGVIPVTVTLLDKKGLPLKSIVVNMVKK